ncbi:hypothetical protein [Bacillus amyloliquefaciens]|uniref:hypothetical protein n=1 Tax=Bacillus amyloliquefaciens TaxID=1390 RepID=UPI002DB9EFD9|nr:hypothetical protein [Bacillus amyloliquefaciens]MEC3841547.1 hypothetical protein [Bacillus amyloliquefaciens]
MEERCYLEMGYEEIGRLNGVKYLGKMTVTGDLFYVSIVGGHSVGHPVSMGRAEIDLFQQFMDRK